MTSLTKCPVCGRDLFEMVENDGKFKLKIFTSYGTTPDGKYYCYECYENLNKKIFKENEDDRCDKSE